MQFCVKNESRENDKTFYITYSGKKHLSAAIKMLFDRFRVVFCYQKEYNCEKRKIMLIRLSYLDLCWSWSSLLWHFMSRIKVAVDPQGPTLNLLYSGVMDGDIRVRDRLLVPVFSHVSSQNTRLWTWPESRTAWYTMLERPSDCPQAQTLHGIPFLCLCCSFMYCTCSCVAWRMDVEMCVTKQYLWCCMQPPYNVSKGTKPTSWQDLYLLYCNATLYPLLAKKIHWVIQWRGYNFGN